MFTCYLLDLDPTLDKAACTYVPSPRGSVHSVPSPSPGLSLLPRALTPPLGPHSSTGLSLLPWALTPPPGSHSYPPLHAADGDATVEVAPTPKTLQGPVIVKVLKETVTILRKIGEGAFGEVSEARIFPYGVVAVKWLKVRGGGAGCAGFRGTQGGPGFLGWGRV